MDDGNLSRVRGRRLLFTFMPGYKQAGKQASCDGQTRVGSVGGKDTPGQGRWEARGMTKMSSKGRDIRESEKPKSKTT